MQKFSLLDDEHEHPRLCDRSNVVVISDEAYPSRLVVPLAVTSRGNMGNHPLSATSKIPRKTHQ